MKNKVAIFGSGLSAAYVHAACVDNGLEADIFTDRSLNEKPDFSMPIKVNWLPSWVTAPQYPIWLFGLGTKQDYLARMGRNGGTTDFPVTGRTELAAYNPADILEQLLPPLLKVVLGRFTDDEIFSIAENYVHTFVTFPMEMSKINRKLVYYYIYYVRGAMKVDVPNMVIYNGTSAFPWTRFTHYWGTYMWEYSHLEYPNGAPKPHPQAALKQIFDIAPGVQEFFSPVPNITMVGRWARWSKSVLAQDAYAQADKILKEIIK